MDNQSPTLMSLRTHNLGSAGDSAPLKQANSLDFAVLPTGRISSLLLSRESSARGEEGFQQAVPIGSTEGLVNMLRATEFDFVARSG